MHELRIDEWLQLDNSQAVDRAAAAKLRASTPKYKGPGASRGLCIWTPTTLKYLFSRLIYLGISPPSVYYQRAQMSEEKELHFKRPPIEEALIGFQCSIEEAALAGWVEDTADRLAARIFDEYPNKEPIHQARFTFDGKIATANSDVIGYRFRNKTNTQIVQLLMGAFAFSRLRPYENWHLMRDEAKKQWEIFQATVGPLKVNSCSLRYVNKFSIPENDKISEYLSIFLNVPPSISKKTENYLTRIETKMSNPNCIAALQQVQLPGDEPEKLTLVVDNEFRVAAEDRSNEELWQTLEQLRHLKNRIFLEMFTDKAKEMFD
jgi:uncharacterized protein (TIGR04255 family)